MGGVQNAGAAEVMSLAPHLLPPLVMFPESMHDLRTLLMVMYFHPSSKHAAWTWIPYTRRTLGTKDACQTWRLGRHRNWGQTAITDNAKLTY